jgi:serine/threonine protein kinase
MAEGRAPGRSTHGGLTSSSLGRGTRLGRYELLAPIGVGGMAKVWAARQSGYGGFAKVVAIKTILPHLSREADFERLFVDEARVASLVRHPNVCEIFELSEEGQVLFLVMEWVDGDSLIKLLKPKGAVVPFDPRIAARIAAETCAGIHAAHTQLDHDGKPLHIVHRDVSPHNILLSAEGVVKVTDFGVAKAAGQTHDQTVAGQLKGKLEYMSPEQITGAQVDGRTDVFGMGGVIYEATTGQQPFASSGDLEVMNKIVEGRLAPPSTHLARYPRELEAIVMRAMATEPSQRFASADEMRLALEDYMARSGPPVTHAEVAGLLRSRVGAKMDERLERIRSAMSANPDKNPSHTPSGAGISTSGVIPTNRPPRVAPAPPAVPKGVVPRVTAPARPAAGAPPRPLSAPVASPTSVEELPDMQPPDSGFNMDTVADFQLPDFLDPGAATLRPAPTPMAMQPIPPHGPPVIVELEPEPDPPAEEGAIDPRQYILAAVVGIGVAVVLGGVAFLAWRFIAPPPVVPSDAPPPGHSQAEPAPRPAPPARSAASTTGAPSSISFRVSPASATLFVDGKPLASSTSPARTMPRLAHGRTATVVARAEGFDDETMQLDDSVSGSVDVVLTRHDTKPAVAANEP